LNQATMKRFAGIGNEEVRRLDTRDERVHAYLTIVNHPGPHDSR
jgi:hypothetical protein